MILHLTCPRCHVHLGPDTVVCSCGCAIEVGDDVREAMREALRRQMKPTEITIADVLDVARAIGTDVTFRWDDRNGPLLALHIDGSFGPRAIAGVSQKACLTTMFVGLVHERDKCQCAGGPCPAAAKALHALRAKRAS